MSYRVSVDTGGTFTDVVLVDTGGKLHVAKALTTYARAFDGIRSSLGEPRNDPFGPSGARYESHLLQMLSRWGYFRQTLRVRT